MEKGLKTLQSASRKKERQRDFNDSGLNLEDPTNNSTDNSSDMGKDDQHSYLDNDEPMHSSHGDEQQLSSHSHSRESQMASYPTEMNHFPRRTFSTTSSASTFTPVSATSQQTLPSIRSTNFFASILQPSSVTTH